MREVDKPCILCGEASEVNRLAKHAYTEYTCPNCGSFVVSDFYNNASKKTLSSMYYFILHNKKASDKRIFFVQDVSSIKDDEAYYVGSKTLESIYPTSLYDRVEKVMLNLSTRLKALGEEIIIPDVWDPYDNNYVFYNLFFVDDTDTQESYKLGNQIYEMLSILQDEFNYIKHIQALGDNENSYTFTARGWNLIYELQANNDELPQAFVAMWFSPDMKEARSAITRAVEDSGYLPVFIDDKEHNNQIVPEIFFEIRRSKFMIADLTGHRNGVYYEAGYAQALDKEVILSCRDTDFASRHFDIAQKNTIQWADADDLYNRLLKRIEACVGKNNTP